jgi:hypothetical protein
MKKLILFISLFAISFVFLQAKTVDFNKAINAAAKVIGESPAKSGMSVFAIPENRLTLVKSVSEESNYYVFNEADGNGFVIISGDDATKPILGYSDKGSFDENNQPPAFTYWLDFLNSEIEYAIENKLPSNPEWETFSNITASAVVVEPLLKTTWDQSMPYNKNCPIISGQNAPTGCIATAMAQVMKYYNYPERGTGLTPAYNNVPAIDLSLAVYDWENMLNDYPLYNYSGTEIEINAVAQLMYHCGASVKMKYGLTGSGAYGKDVAIALINYFDYDAGIVLKERDFYSTTEWEYILRQQLDAGIPVFYSGESLTAGHAFVCDGYRDDGYFHFNWGWGGYQDGYFVTTSLNPNGGGTGSGIGSYDNAQEIIINIKPNAGGTLVQEMTMNKISQMYSATTQIKRNTNFSVSTSLRNGSFLPFSGYLGIALVDDNDNILAILGKYSSKLNLNPNTTYSYLSITSNVPANIPLGDYKMKTVVMTETDTTFVRAMIGFASELPLKVIQAATGISLDKSEIILGIGNTYQLTENVLPANANNKAVTWSSANVNVATVENGLITAKGLGSTTITVKSVDGNFIANCIVTVKAGLSTVKLNPMSGTLPTKNTLTEEILGGGVELPVSIPCNSEWEFAGWSHSKINTQTTLVEEENIIPSLIPAGLHVPESSVELFAVYKKYVNNGLQETIISSEDFEGNLYDITWRNPFVFGLADGNSCIGFVEVDDFAMSPVVTNPSNISFYTKRLNGYTGSISFLMSVYPAKSVDLVYEEIFVLNSPVVDNSFEKHNVELNLTGDYQIFFFLTDIEDDYYLSLLIDDITISNSRVEAGYVYLSETGGYCPTTSSINETMKYELSVYPNPVEDIVYISGEESNIKVFDIKGTLLQTTFGNQVNLSTYDKGIYLLQINDVWKKIVKK